MASVTASVQSVKCILSGALLITKDSLDHPLYIVQLAAGRAAMIFTFVQLATARACYALHMWQA